MEPLVSVIMLTYDREHFLGEAVKSVLDQTWTQLELIVIDDGSTDNSRAVMEGFRDLRIRYVYQEHSGHASRLRNQGIALAKGEWIAFIDSDDVWDKTKIELQMAVLKNSGPSFSFTGYRTVDASGKEEKHSLQYDSIYPDTLFKSLMVGDTFIYPSTILFSKNCVQQAGGFYEGISWSDNEFIQRLACHFPAHIIKIPLASIIKHDTNVSGTIPFITEMVEEMEFSLNKFYTQKAIHRSVFRKGMAHYSFHKGKFLWQQRKALPASRAFIRSILYEPFSMRNWYRVMVSVTQGKPNRELK